MTAAFSPVERREDGASPSVACPLFLLFPPLTTHLGVFRATRHLPATNGIRPVRMLEWSLESWWREKERAQSYNGLVCLETAALRRRRSVPRGGGPSSAATRRQHTRSQGGHFWIPTAEVCAARSKPHSNSHLHVLLDCIYNVPSSHRVHLPLQRILQIVTCQEGLRRTDSRERVPETVGLSLCGVTQGRGQKLVKTWTGIPAVLELWRQNICLRQICTHFSAPLVWFTSSRGRLVH